MRSQDEIQYLHRRAIRDAQCDVPPQARVGHEPEVGDVVKQAEDAAARVWRLAIDKIGGVGRVGRVDRTDADAEQAKLRAVGFVLQQLAQGLDRLHVAAAATVLAQLLLVALFALAVGVGSGLSPASALALRGAAFTAAGLTCAFWLWPTFRRVRHWNRKFLHQARDWGFQVYIGRVLSIGTYNMDVLMLGIWTTSRNVGFYVLAGSLATVSGLPVTGAAAALFGRMARAESLRRQWLVMAIGVGTVSALVAWLLAKPVITLFFGHRYAGAAALVLPLALAQLVRGVTTMFNTFLSAHGRGTDLRNAGFVLALSNVAFNFALIPHFGAQGAAWASLLALGANFLAHIYFYRRAYA